MWPSSPCSVTRISAARAAIVCAPQSPLAEACGSCVTRTPLTRKTARRSGPGLTARLVSTFPAGLENYVSPELSGSINAESVWNVMRTGAKVVASTGGSPVPGLRA